MIIIQFTMRVENADYVLKTLLEVTRRRLNALILQYHEILLLSYYSMGSDPSILLRDRVEFKLYSAKYHLEEIKKLKEHHAAGLHDDMPSVHLEMEVDCFLNQVYGAIDALLVLINNKMNLGFPINTIKIQNIESKLKEIGRLDLITDLSDALQPGHWLADLYELRNHSVHREKLKKMREYDSFKDQARVYISKKQRETSFSPSDHMPIEQTQYFEESLDNVRQLIHTIRMKDSVLQIKEEN